MPEGAGDSGFFFFEPAYGLKKGEVKSENPREEGGTALSLD
jgi:hypothetical protein